jgi:hypothetical protein
MDESCRYEIRVAGHLGERWSDWFAGLAIHNDLNGETTLSGELADQAALFGVLARIHDLNLTLISVQRLPEWSDARKYSETLEP